MATHQLALNIQLRDDATMASFHPGLNEEALNAVMQIVVGSGEPFLYLWGPTGVGKTHLLQAACHKASEKNVAALYLSFENYLNFSPQMLQGIEGVSLICLDEIDNIKEQPLWEEALFHLFNRIYLQKNRLLVAAKVPPKNLKIALSDLKSRLTSGVVYQLHKLTDEQKVNALQLRALQRGLTLPTAVGQFLLNRCSRNMAELFNILESLDKASLVKQRRLTIPFVKQVLNL